ncbi:ribonuclease H-like domain-containing protein [Tanacetum coccineum]
MPVETPSSTALVSCDGLGGYDWSDQAEEGPNFALMAYSSSGSDSEVSNDSTCSKSCLECVNLLKTQYDQLSKDFKKSKLMVLVVETRKSDEIVSDSQEKDMSQTEKKTVKPRFIKFVKPKEKTTRETVKISEKPSQNTHIPRGNQRNWNNMMSQKLGSNFEMFNKACFVCRSFYHLQANCNYHQHQRMEKPVWNNAQRVNHQNSKKTHPCDIRNMVPREVLMKSSSVSPNTARQVNTTHSKPTVNAARPMKHPFKLAHSTVKRPIHKSNSQMDLQDKGVIDSGCSRHMTGNMSYLTDYEEIDGGYVAFGGNPKGGKITGKATKDETSGILKSFITGIENLSNHKVKIIRCDNGTEFKNKEMNQFCKIKGNLRQFSVARTPQQNRVAERRNRTLIEAARTMLVDSKLLTTFWAEAVNTTC